MLTERASDAEDDAVTRGKFITLEGIDGYSHVIVIFAYHRVPEAEREAHIQRGLVKALDALDEVIALIRRSPTVESAREGLIELLGIDCFTDYYDPAAKRANVRELSLEGERKCAAMLECAL
mgnify:CR=1 FL=1